MTSPQRNRKGATQFQPMQTEALGLSIHPVNNESSPPLAAMSANVAANSPPSKRGSQIRVPSGPTAPTGPSQLSQEVQSNVNNPPSPSHTASPPSAASGFPPQSQREQQLQQSPPQMAQTASQINNYGWPQNRVPAPTMNTNGSSTGTGLGSRMNDSWVPPDADMSPDPLSNRNKKPPVEERDEVQQHSPNRNGDWNVERGSRGSNGSDPMVQRSSPTSQLLSGGANRPPGSASFAPNRNRPRGPTQASSSPVMMQAMAIRQQQLQQSPPNPQQSQPPSASSSQVRGTPPSLQGSLQGLIPPRDLNPAAPLLSRSQTENAGSAAAAAGVRPLNTPPGGNPYPTARRDTTTPPARGMPPVSLPAHHTPLESPAGEAGRNPYMSAASSMTDLNSQRLPFEYDRDDDQRMHQDPRNRARQNDQYNREGSSSPIPARTLPNPPNQAPRPVMQQASSSVGSGFRVPMRFPVHEEPEFDDEIPQPQGPPPRWAGQQQQQQQQQQHTSQSRERDRLPSPPPAPPSPHPPIPLFSPQSIQAAQPPVLHDSRNDSTPSPPAPLRINPNSHSSGHTQDDDLEPAEASSDHFTPKSPNAPLPADHGYTYTNNNAGRYGSRLPPRTGGTPGNGYRDMNYGSLQHAMFAMQMGGMQAPRGPISSFANYPGSPSFTSLGGVAAALSGKSESPYPPPPINTDVNGSRSASGYGGSAESGGANGNQYDPSSWEGAEQSTYPEFIEFQRRMYASRPDAPIPPTPHSYTSPQQAQHPRDAYGSNNTTNNHSGGNNGNGHGYGGPMYGNGYGPPANFDPSMIPDRYIPSALSSYLSSPMMHNPFLPRFPPPQSLVSSPSHIPLDLPPAPPGGRRLHKKKSKKQLRGSGSGGGGPNGKGPKGPSKLSQPPQVLQVEEMPRIGAESTVPKDSSSEESDTDDTKKGASGPERKGGGGGEVVRGGGMGPVNGTGMETSEEEDDDDDVWLDEDSEDELDAEVHSKYIQNPSKRKRKWEQKWDAMVRLFQEIDRTTDSPMILLASPSTANSPKTHILISRSIQRNPGRYMPHAQTARKSFVEISKLRRKEKAEAAAAERARRAAGFEQQLANVAFIGARFDDSGSAGRGSSSPGSAGFTPGLGALEKLQDLPQLAAGGEDGLKQALSVALESLKQMHSIYEQREERRREELERQRQEAAGLEYLFRAAALDMNNGPSSAGSPSSTGRGVALSGKKSP